jgi:hypothetical protein|tara:strand:- start:8066 stop:8497 length:432 start_codon:yes stop_codon:yes gene_type:complete
MTRHGKPIWIRRIAICCSSGALLGALVLGTGSRIVMRILANIDGREAGFSLEGSLEIMLYGAIVGLVGGALLLPLMSIWRLGRWGGGTIFGLLAYAGTILTLPPHIATTAAPFSNMMPFVLMLFAVPFILYGIALQMIIETRI